MDGASPTDDQDVYLEQIRVVLEEFGVEEPDQERVGDRLPPL